MTAVGIVLATQALDALALVLALPTGSEQNPLMAALLGAGGIGAVVVLKLVAGLGIGIVTARHRPGLAPVLGTMGCVGALTALVAVVGA